MARRKAEASTEVDLTDARFSLDRDPELRRLRQRMDELSARRGEITRAIPELARAVNAETVAGGNRASRRQRADEAADKLIDDEGGVAVAEVEPAPAERLRAFEAEQRELGIAIERCRQRIADGTGRVSKQVCDELGDHHRAMIRRVVFATIELAAANQAVLDLYHELETRGVSSGSLTGRGQTYASDTVDDPRRDGSATFGWLRELTRLGIVSTEEIEGIIGDSFNGNA